MPRSEITAVAALAAVVLVGLSLRWLLPADELVYSAVQFRRSCWLYGQASWIDSGVRIALGVMIVAALAGGAGRRPRVVLGLALLVVGGAATGELLKTVFERVRPSDSPGDIVGNSFPSGHVMNTTLFAVAVWRLAREAGFGPGGRLVVGTLGIICVAAQAVFRILNGSHWVTDVPVSVLLGVAWMLGAGSVARRPRGAGALAVAGAAAFATFYWVPELRIPLPSVLVADRPALESVELGEPRDGMRGEWSHGWREPIGAVSWAVGSEVSIRAGGRSGEAAMLRIAVRPPGRGEGGEGCLRLAISVNDWTAPVIDLVEGWRELHVAPPSGTLDRDENVVRLRVLGDIRRPGATAPGVLAVRYLRFG